MGPQSEEQKAKGFIGFSGGYETTINETIIAIRCEYQMKWIKEIVFYN